MKLLLDENLSPRLAAALADLFPGTMHVCDCRLKGTPDSAVWEFAAAQGFTIVSEDSDFNELSALHGTPPKVVWLHVGNCATMEIETILRRFALAIADFINHPEDRCLVLKRRSFRRVRKG
jgi:predicted nuclease of predicted toxin-antitoxin system